MRPGTSVGSDFKGAQPVCRHDDRAERLAGSDRHRLHVHARAEAAQHVDERDARRD